MPAKSLDINKLYREVCAWMIGSLKHLGIKSELKNKNDVIVCDKKISGNAAKILNNSVFLQHGTLVYDVDVNLTASLLKVSDKSLIKGKVTSVLEHVKTDESSVIGALKKVSLKGRVMKLAA